MSVSLDFWYHAVRLLLVSFILGDSNWNFVQVGYPVDSHTNSALKQTSFGIPPLSLRNRTKRSARYTKLMGVTSKSARLNCTKLTHFRLTAGRFRGNSCIVILWVACGLLQFAATQ